MKKTSEEIATVVLEKIAAGFLQGLVNKIKPKVPTSLTIDLPNKASLAGSGERLCNAARKLDQSRWGWLPPIK